MSTAESRAISIAETMIQEFLQESITTQRVLERVSDSLSWQPHEKSMTMGRLATHIAEIPLWSGVIVNHDDFDMGVGEYKPVTLASPQEILATYQKNRDALVDTVRGKSNEMFLRPWRLLNRGHVSVELPRVAALRSFVLSHLIHHRGQLSVYLRLNNIPVPAMYGPSADER